jgi:hypothetical protein
MTENRPGLDAPPITPDGQELSTEDWEAIRAEARRSPFFMAKGILGYNLISARTHRAFCDSFLDPALRQCKLMPRSHLKTTIGTISETIREVACDPNIRILIANETATNAQLMLTEIKNHFTQNERFRMFFPELIPDNFKKALWNAQEIQVPREAIWREPTVSTIGTGGVVVSRHFDLMKFDDLVGAAALKSPTVMADAIQWLNHSVSLLVNAYTSRIHLIGTRWALFDVYSHAVEKMGFELFLRKAIVQGPTGPEPFFPEQVSMEFLQKILETDPFQWATQYANDPFDASDADFKAEWLQYFTLAPGGGIRFRDEQGVTHNQNMDELEVYMHVDPSMGESDKADATAIITIGLNAKGQIFVLDAFKERITPDEQIERIFELGMRFSPRVVSIEAVGYQGSLQYYLEKEMRRRNTYLRIEPWRPERGGAGATREARKNGRILKTLQPFFANRLVFLRSEQASLVEEYLAFGRIHADLLDALHQGPSFWKTPLDGRVLERRRRQRQKFLDIPMGVTGYGV